MSNLGPVGPEHSGNPIRFKRNRPWAMPDPGALLNRLTELYQTPDHYPEARKKKTFTCDDCPSTGCEKPAKCHYEWSMQRRGQNPTNAPTKRAQPYQQRPKPGSNTDNVD